MPLVPFEELPDHARLWTFAASRRLSDQETARLLAATDEFLTSWAAHRVPLATASEWRLGQFLFVAVDEGAAGASDARSTHSLGSFGRWSDSSTSG